MDDQQQIQMYTRKRQYEMMLILVCLSTIMVFSAVAGLFFFEIPAANKDMVANLLPIIVTAWVGITMYFFSTSASSANKDDKPVKPVL